MQSKQCGAMALSIGIALGMLGAVGDVSAWGRTVVVNGQVMAGSQLEALDRAHCMRIPDGNYFLSQTNDGRYVWGYATLPGIPQGYLGEECGYGQSRPAGGYRLGGNSSWSDEYSRVYGGGVSAGDGTVEIYDGASGGFIYEQDGSGFQILGAKYRCSGFLQGRIPDEPDGNATFVNMLSVSKLDFAVLEYSPDIGAGLRRPVLTRFVRCLDILLS